MKPLKATRRIECEYFDLNDLPLNDLPYSAIDAALKDEKYMRKYPLINLNADLNSGYPAALLIRYPEYVDSLYNLAYSGLVPQHYFSFFAKGTYEAFEYLFEDLNAKLNSVVLGGGAYKTTALGETKLKGLL